MGFMWLVHLVQYCTTLKYTTDNSRDIYNTFK
jgi:hypothetical protein